MKKMYNNAATIRSMTTRQLANFLYQWKVNSALALGYGVKQMMTEEEIMEWLHSDDFDCGETKGVRWDD